MEINVQHRCPSGFGPPPVQIRYQIWSPRKNSASGYGPPLADLDPPAKTLLLSDVSYARCLKLVFFTSFASLCVVRLYATRFLVDRVFIKLVKNTYIYIITQTILNNNGGSCRPNFEQMILCLGRLHFHCT